MTTTSTIELSAPTTCVEPSSKALRAALAVAGLAVAAVLALAAVDLAAADWDPTIFLRVGEDASARPFVAADIPETRTVPGWGHDGQANYVLAATFPDIPAAEGHLDSVTYRARRIVYPALLAVVPSGRPLAFAMVIVNVAAIAAAAVAMGELAVRRASPRLTGAIVGVTPAFLASLVLGLGDALALALVASGVVAWQRSTTTVRSSALAVILMTLAALTRETTLVIPGAFLLASLSHSAGASSHGDRRPLLLLVPAAVVGAWVATLQLWFGGPDRSATQFGVPFGGWVDAGLGSVETISAAALVMLSVLVATRLWNGDRAWALVVTAEAVILCCVDRGVLIHILNLARVTPWVIPWAAVVLTSTSAAAPVAAATTPVADGSGPQVVPSLTGR